MTEDRMQRSRGGMGSRKHGRSGVAPKSPRVRFHMKREAEKMERKTRRVKCKHRTVTDLLNSRS